MAAYIWLVFMWHVGWFAEGKRSDFVCGFNCFNEV